MYHFINLNKYLVFHLTKSINHVNIVPLTDKNIIKENKNEQNLLINLDTIDQPNRNISNKHRHKSDWNSNFHECGGFHVFIILS